MERDVALSKLGSLERCVHRISERIPPSAEQLASNADTQDIISVNLQRAVQLCVDLALMIVAEHALGIPANMAESFSLLKERGWITPEVERSMRSAVGFRNISVHEYRRLDWAIVHQLVNDHLDDFRIFAAQLAEAGLLKTP